MKRVTRLALGLLALTLLPSCGSDKQQSVPLFVSVGALAVSELKKRNADSQAPKKPPVTRAAIEKAGKPVLRAAVPALGSDRRFSVLDTKGDVVTWKVGEVTMSLRQGVLIQTRGLGPDLMSAKVPTVAQLLQDGGSHERQYFFLGADDQPTRRTFDCTVAVAGREEIEIFQKKHQVTRITETCARPQSGKVTNEFWFEGPAIRKSRQWASARAGYILFERVVD